MINIKQYGHTGLSLVLFHGWGFDNHIFHPLLPDLQRHYQVYCVDLPGFGETPWMDWSAFQTNLLSVLPKQFAVAGWSLGGLYATRLALENSERITHLLNIASSPFFQEAENWSGIKTQILENFHANLMKNAQQTLQDFQALQKYHPVPAPGKLPSEMGLQRGLDILQNWDLRLGLITFDKPVCYFFGRLDAIVPVSTMNCMQKIYPDFQFVLCKKSAHIPFLSETAFFMNVLQDFVV